MFCLVLLLNHHLALESVASLLWGPEQFLAVGPKAPKSHILLIISLHERYPAHTEGQSHTAPDPNGLLPRER